MRRQRMGTLSAHSATPKTLCRREIYAIVDRLVSGSATDSRLRDSLETAFTKGRGRCYAFVENGELGAGAA